MRTDNWLVYEALQNERARRVVGSDDDDHENDSDNKNENDEKARRGKQQQQRRSDTNSLSLSLSQQSQQQQRRPARLSLSLSRWESFAIGRALPVCESESWHPQFAFHTTTQKFTFSYFGARSLACFGIFSLCVLLQHILTYGITISHIRTTYTNM